MFSITMDKGLNTFKQHLQLACVNYIDKTIIVKLEMV